MAENGAYKRILFSVCYPLLVLAFQLLPIWATAAVAALFLLVAAFIARYRAFLFLSAFTGIGHVLWVLLMSFTTAHVKNTAISTIAGRVGLIGYILLFLLWQKKSATTHQFWHVGDYNATIKMPFVWFGHIESVGRFLLIFSSLFIVAASAVFIITGTARLILAGAIFAIVNAVLEEIVWRGFILARLADAVGEVDAVLSTSVAFGFYHISLGFSFGACLAFALGGFFFAGAAFKSKGLSAPILMHIVVNIFFVSIGLIF